VTECRNLKVTPHVARNVERSPGSAINARTTQHPGYATSERKRKRIEECFGWLKTIALLRKVRHRGIFKVGWGFTFAGRRLQPSPHAESRDGSSVSQNQKVSAEPENDLQASQRIQPKIFSRRKSKWEPIKPHPLFFPQPAKEPTNGRQRIGMRFGLCPGAKGELTSRAGRAARPHPCERARPRRLNIRWRSKIRRWPRRRSGGSGD
jgi:hypothetical protein